MKRLFILTAFVLAAAGCSRDYEELSTPGGEVNAGFTPHFYGMATLDNSGSPSTRGVAQTMKVWSRPVVQNNLTVKFLNGSENYRRFVRSVASEWEKATGVRFFFVGDNADAIIRIGFDCVEDMKSSWSLTGTDHMQVYNRQNEPTMHFAQWPRTSDEQKRADVLRAFGQALGLELEFRHPSFHPAWITDAEGNVDEAKIRAYWEKELAGYISWEELKKVVLEPLQNNDLFIAKTDSYDSLSVMTWPFYRMIAENIPPIEFDNDYNTELSEQDKAFIKTLYGETLGNIPRPQDYISLIEFDYFGPSLEFKVTTSKRLVVIWDWDAKECTYVELPADATSRRSATLSHTFPEAGKRRIIIGEMLEYGQPKPKFSDALSEFDFTEPLGADNFDFKTYNRLLAKVKIRGDYGFTDQLLDFSSNAYIKDLYLRETMNSRLTAEGSENLVQLASTPFILTPKTVVGPLYPTISGEPVNGVYETEGPEVEWEAYPEYPAVLGWPVNPIDNPSLMEANTAGCTNLTTVSLDNTHVKKLDFSDNGKLEYVYLSSFPDYIVGGGTPAGQYLLDAFNTLPDRSRDSTGTVVLRGVNLKYMIEKGHDAGEVIGDIEVDTGTIVKLPIAYRKVKISMGVYRMLTRISIDKNWRIIWDSGLQVTLN